MPRKRFGSSGRPYGSIGCSVNGIERPEYFVWHRMIRRCYNESDSAFKNYGARGISVCPEWRGSFLAFFKAVGPRPSAEYSIERIDNNGNYEVGNVKWARMIDQANNRRNNVFVEVNGEEVTMAQAARMLGISYKTASQRYAVNGEVERAEVVRGPRVPGTPRKIVAHA